jgi:predicted outer membrane repeat protein
LAVKRWYLPMLEPLEDRLAPAVFTVNTLLDESGGSQLSLRDAIGEAGSADTIVFAAGLSGTMSLTAALPNLTASVQILGPGPGQLTIDGGGLYQILAVTPTTVGTTVSISGLTMANGVVNAALGGAILGNSLSNITLNNCAFTGDQAAAVNPVIENTAGAGGAIWSGGNLTVTNSTFTGNSAYDGGAIREVNGTMLLSNDTFAGNFAGQLGGAISCFGSDTVQNCVFTGNIAGPSVHDGDGEGGAIDAAGGTLIATNDTFTGNAANGTGTGTSNSFGGGAIDVSGTAVDIAACTFAGNTSQTNGGAIDADSAAVIVDSTFSGNRAQDGAGLSFRGPATQLVQLTNDTIWANTGVAVTAAPIGAGIHFPNDATVTLDNTIVAGNTINYPSYATPPSDISGSVAVAAASANNLIGDSNSADGLTSGSNGNIVGVTPDLLPLGNYGGPTETMLPAPGSPAIDAGSTAFVTDQATDQRGFSRTSGDGKHVDIGAVEVQPGGVGTHLELQGPATASVGSDMSWTAIALDDNNLPAYTAFGPIVMSVAAGPGKFTSASTTIVGAVYGTAAFNNLTIDTPGYYRVQASFGNSAVTASLVVTGQLVFVTEPDNTTAGKSITGTSIINEHSGYPITLAIEDLSGNVIQGDVEAVTVTLFSASPFLNGQVLIGAQQPFSNGLFSATLPLQNGVANFSNLVVTQASVNASGYVLQASVGGVSVNSILFQVTPAAASKLVFLQQPTNVTVGKPISPAVKVAVEDQYGNIVVTQADPKEGMEIANSAKPHLILVEPPEPDQGIATFSNIVFKKPGTYTLIAEFPPASSATSTSFTVLPADPVVGPSQSAVVNAKYATPLYAKVTDLAGNPLAGKVVTFTAPATGPSGTFAGGHRTVTVKTNAAGIATAPAFTANTKAGNFVVTVSFGGAAPAETIALSNLAGPPAHLKMVGAAPDATTVNSDFPALPAALVTDRYGNPISGVPVTFTAPTSGSSGAFRRRQHDISPHQRRRYGHGTVLHGQHHGRNLRDDRVRPRHVPRHPSFDQPRAGIGGWFDS